MATTISDKQSKNKKLLLEQLKITPIVEVACKKVGVGRATYYRWRQEDADFAVFADQALQEGSAFISDVAESQLISFIRDKNLSATIFWLKTHHKLYTNKVELTGKIKTENQSLTPEQEELLKKALELASFRGEKSDEPTNN